MHPDIDISLDRYMPELKVKFGQNWGEHRCKKPGKFSASIYDLNCIVLFVQAVDGAS